MKAFVILCILVLIEFSGYGKEAPYALEPSKTVIMNTHSFWRTHVTLRPVVYGTRANAAPSKKPWGSRRGRKAIDKPGIHFY